MGKTYDQGVSNGERKSLTEDVTAIKDTLGGMFGPDGTCQKRALTIARLGATVKVLLVVFTLLVGLNIQTWRSVNALREAIGRAAAGDETAAGLPELPAITIPQADAADAAGR